MRIFSEESDLELFAQIINNPVDWSDVNNVRSVF